jgi:RNA polymerase sigma factor (sigma-70 family)
VTPRLVAESARLAGQPLLRCQTDRRLVDLVRAGNDRAFEAIVDRYRSPLLRYCGRLLPPTRAEDAVQQSFLNAYAAMQRGDAELDLRPWLYRIARNACLNALRENGWSHEQIDNLRRGTESAQDVFERQAELREVMEAVHTLPERQRDAVVLRELEGRSYDEIAEALDSSDGAVRQLLNRARNTLRAGVTAVTPTALLGRLVTPRTHRVVAQVSEAVGHEGVRITATRAAGIAAASLLFFGGLSQTSRLPGVGADELSPGSPGLSVATSGPPRSAPGGLSAPNGFDPTGPAIPIGLPRGEAAHGQPPVAGTFGMSRGTRRQSASTLPASATDPAPPADTGGGDGPRRPGTWLAALARSIVAAARQVVGRRVTAPVAEAVEQVVGDVPRDRSEGAEAVVSAPAARSRAVTGGVSSTVKETAVSATTTAPVAEADRDPVRTDARRGTESTKPEPPGEDSTPPDGDTGRTQAEPAAGGPEPVAAGEVTVTVGEDPVPADATQPTELVDGEDGGSDDDEEINPDDDQSDDGDDKDDEDDDGVPLDLGLDGR